MALDAPTDNFKTVWTKPLSPVVDDKPLIPSTSPISQENKEGVEKNRRLSCNISPTPEVAYTFHSSETSPTPTLTGVIGCIQSLVKPLALFTKRDTSAGKAVRITATLLAFLMLVSIHFLSGPLATTLLIAAIGLSTINITRTMMEMALDNQKLNERGMEPISWYKTKMMFYSLLLLTPLVTPLLLFAIAPESFQLATVMLEMEKTFNKAWIVTLSLLLTMSGQSGLLVKEVCYSG
jgi:succinate dehydrogenase hydrophobic anchor subunit